MIATVDKFASVPWDGRGRRLLRSCGPRTTLGFYGAAEPAGGQPLGQRRCRHRPHHPGRAAPDLRPARHGGRPLRDGNRPAVHRATINGERRGPRSSPRPRRCGGPRRRSAACSTARDRDLPAARRRPRRQLLRQDRSRYAVRLYVGVAAPGRGPKLVFLRDAADTALGRRRALSAERTSTIPPIPI